MKVLLILGCGDEDIDVPRMAGAFVEGLQGSGGEAECVLLGPLKLEACRHCEEYGWASCRDEGQCELDDDLGGVVERIRQADAVVWATPVQGEALAPSMGLLLERLRRICLNSVGQEGITGKAALGLCVYSEAEGATPWSTLKLEFLAGLCGFDLLDMISVRPHDLEPKLKLLRNAGRWFAASIPSALPAMLAGGQAEIKERMN